MKRIIIGQAGGPTSVINATLSGLVKGLKDDCELLFVLDGYEGLVKKKIMKGTTQYINWILQQENSPGACLGSGRYQMTNDEMIKIIDYCKANEIDGIVFIGGNGTMEALNKIKIVAKKQNYLLQVIGLPKTVDNDLYYTDHAPGFGSAAKYIAYAVKDLILDLRSMKNFEQVRVIETMGRNAGWLAAASGYFKKGPSDAPHFIALPEKQLKKHELLESIKIALKEQGYAIVVVSEGVRWQNDTQIERAIINGRVVLGGIAEEVSQCIRDELDVIVRTEVLGMMQRCSSTAISEIDYKEAFKVGEKGAISLKAGKSDVMITLTRADSEDYQMEMQTIALEKVATSGERLMPQEFIDDPDKYYNWLKPLIDHN